MLLVLFFAIKQSLDWGFLLLQNIRIYLWKNIYLHWGGFSVARNGNRERIWSKIEILNFVVVVICLYCINSAGQGLIWIFRGFQVFYTYFKCSSTLSNRFNFHALFYTTFNVEYTIFWTYFWNILVQSSHWDEDAISS